MDNLENIRQIALVVWDPEADRGYQLLGWLKEIEEWAVIDWYLPELREGILRQIDRELAIRVDQILRFSHMPHSDEPE